MSTLAVEVEHLAKSFGGLRVVDDVSFSVPMGEVRGIVGPNGAGKTTLLNLLSGLLKPDQGRVAFLGRDLTSLPMEARAELGVSRSFQINSLFESLPLRDNLRLAALGKHRGALGFIRTPQSGADADVERTAEHFDLVNHLDAIVGSLPYGSQRLAELAVACVARPSVLLLDEPASGLGLSERSQLADNLRAISGPDIALVMIEHDMDLIRQVCDSLTVLDRGRVIADGPMEDVMNDPEVNRVYLGRAA